MQTDVRDAENKVQSSLGFKRESPVHDREKRNRSLRISSLLALAFISLAAIGFLDGNLHHLVVELTSVALTISIFTVTCTSERFIGNSYLSVIGYGQLFFGALELIHALEIGGFEYRGFPADTAEKALMIARLVQGITLTAAFSRLGKPIRTGRVLVAYILFFFLTTALIILMPNFPSAVIQALDATLFGSFGNYAVMLLILISAINLVLHRRKIEKSVLTLHLTALGLMFVSEILLETGLTVFEAAYRADHYFRLAAGVCIYQAVVQTGIRKPYSTIYHDMEQESVERERARKEIVDFIQLSEESPNPVLRISGNGDILYLNKAAGIMLRGLERLPSEGLPPDLSKQAVDALDRKRPDSARVSTEAADRTYLLYFLPLPSDRQILVYGTDISEYRKLEQEIVHTREEAEAANHVKSEFLASMSHEFRTPISGILGMMELLRSRIKGQEEREYLELARRSAYSLLSIIGEILDISRIEAGKEEIRPDDCDITSELSQMASMFELQAIDRGLSLRLDIAPNVPARIRTDWEKVSHILRNLILNALKYTDSGEISIIVRNLRTADSIAVIEFTVNDTGIGIPKAKLPLLFQNFSRVHSPAIQASSEGAGLGLSISRHLVELLGGTITVRSESGKGSTFTFSLTVEVLHEKQVEGNPPSRYNPDTFRPLRFLVAEDDRINQIFIRTILEKEGHMVTVAGNGVEAVEAVRASIIDGKPFDLVLMDIQMPAMNGIEATGHIRELGHTARHIPIVALTAFALKGDRERFLSAGLDDYLTKPVDMERLSELITKLKHRNMDRPASSGDGAARS